jgi:hypothetical protein
MRGLVPWLLLIGVLVILFVVFGGLKNRVAIIAFVIIAAATSVMVAFFLRKGQ